MGIDVYISNQTINKWFQNLVKEIDFLTDCTIHKNLDALYSSLLHVNASRVVLLDVEDKASCDYFTSIKNGFNNINCIAVGLNNSITDVFTYFNLGFYAYIDLNYSSIELYQAISKSSICSKYLSASQQERLLDYLSHNIPSHNNHINNHSVHTNGHNGNCVKYSDKSLTDNEKKVCEFLLKGFTYKEIAHTLGVTSFTINQRVKGIYKKLQVRSRAELSFRYLS
jgi:DNA-binding NarL/FixJ family response regulator